MASDKKVSRIDKILEILDVGLQSPLSPTISGGAIRQPEQQVIPYDEIEYVVVNNEE